MWIYRIFWYVRSQFTTGLLLLLSLDELDGYLPYRCCCEYASAVRYSLLNSRKQRVLYQGLCNQHLIIRYYDQSLLAITIKEGRGYI
jgi:hypothetical protein